MELTMSQFNLENEIQSLTKLDAPLSKGPMLRWQRTGNESDIVVSVSNMSLNASASQRTPSKKLPLCNSAPSTPDGRKTPHSNSKYKTSASAKKAPKTPKTGDRFIPNRSATNFDLGHFRLTNAESNEADDIRSPSQREFEHLMSDNLNGDVMSSKILGYKGKAPQAPCGHQNSLKVLYSTSKGAASKNKLRHIPQMPERILDAPDILDDYYLNLLDWSSLNQLAVSLGSSVYLWNAATGSIQQLMTMDSADEYIGSVAWIQEGNYLAIGTSNGEVQLWDVTQQKRLRNMNGHAARVGALSWNSYILSSGSRTGSIHHHDVRVAEHQVSASNGHTQEVCGLQWSPDSRYLASGGNDNLLNIWPGVQGSGLHAEAQPMYTCSQHQAAVKALAWCPWQPSILATGGGTADRNIRFWNCNTGSLLNSVDTKSQVCSLLWSREYRELISSHGYAHNQLIIWKYPGMSKVTELTGHTSRVLHMAMSPDGSTVVSAGADETLRIWKCFSVNDVKKKSMGSASKTTGPLSMRTMIR